jgi:hypothetical protein
LVGATRLLDSVKLGVGWMTSMVKKWDPDADANKAAADVERQGGLNDIAAKLAKPKKSKMNMFSLAR